MSDILTANDAIAIAEVVHACARTAHVRWMDLDEDGRTGDIFEGTARHVVHDTETAAFLGDDDDVRDAFVRITTVGGMDTFIPMRQVLRLWHLGYFCV